jgi:hypothetical protein
MPFSGPWPSSGSMRNGVVSERRTLGPRTSGTESSSWPTPDASVRTGFNRSCPDGAARRPLLAEMVTQLPDEWDFIRKQAAKPIEGETDNEYWERQNLIPRNPNPGPSWPTPDVPNGGRSLPEGVTPESSTLDGLDDAVALETWPTPTATDSKSSGASYAKTETHNPGVTLTDAVLRIHPLDLTMPGAGRIISANGPGLSRRVLSPRFVEALMGWPDRWTEIE